MKKTNTERGITLIALIITIIVLLILAVVTISAVTGTGIIQHAKNATSEYQKKAEEENEILQGYIDEIEENIPEGSNKQTGSSSKWTQEGTTLTRTNADGTTTQVKIGDYVNYDEGTTGTHTPDTSKGAGTSKTGGSDTEGWTLGTSELTTEDLKWRVLGVNKDGELELISETPTTQQLYLANDEGYVNAEDNLNNFCNDLYGKGQYATKARSLNIDDINNLTKYDPTTFSGYGNKYTYRYPTQEEMDAFTGTTNSTRYMQYRVDKPDGTVVQDWKNVTYSYCQTFRLPEETTAISSTNPGSKELINTRYDYNIIENLTIDDGYTQDEVTEILNIILGKYYHDDYYYCEYCYFWLASKCVYCSESATYCMFSVIEDGEIKGEGTIYPYFSTIYYSYQKSQWLTPLKVRPVITLESDIVVSTNDNANSVDNMWTLSK